MALLEKIGEMKQAGLSENQIINYLKEEGFSPREIAEAINQSKIKSAVALPQESQEDYNNDQMQPSIMQAQEQQTTQINQYSQANQQQSYLPQQNYAQEVQDPNQYPAYTEQQYAYPNSSQEAYAPQGIDIETIRDIAKQEIDESLKKIRSQIEVLGKDKTNMSFELQNLDNRLTKIESIIQELQTAIIRRIGEYGESITNISDELKATQNSFSKLINPIINQKRAFPKDVKSQENNIKQKTSLKTKPSPRVRDASNVEDYFR